MCVCVHVCVSESACVHLCVQCTYLCLHVYGVCVYGCICVHACGCMHKVNVHGNHACICNMSEPQQKSYICI